MSQVEIIDLTPENISDYGICGYKDVKKHKELRSKIDWFKEYYSKGLTIKALISVDGSYQGMIEYIPGEYAYRPVNAKDFLFIHCVFVGFRKEYKGKGYGALLLDSCIKDAKDKGFSGVAVTTRKGSFMAGDDFFVKNGFEVVDSVKPDFNLLALGFDDSCKTPSFKKDSFKNLEKYKEGLTIIRSVQCPYTEKNVNAIIKTAKDKFGLNCNLMDIESHIIAQETPSPFGSFCMIYNGEVISHHPISNRRFENIMGKKL